MNPDTATLPVAHVEGFEDVRVLQPGIEFYVERIRRRAPFAMLKRTHGFWDRVVDLMEVLPDYPWLGSRRGLRRHRGIDRLLRRIAPEKIEEPHPDRARERLREFKLTEAMIDDLSSRSSFKGFWQGRFMQDLIDDLRSPLDDEAFYESIAFSGRPGGGVRGRHDVRRLRHAWRVLWDGDRLPHDALVWKNAVIAGGGFRPLLQALEPFAIVLVGPGHLASFGERVGWDDMRHIEIHPKAAIPDRDAILDRCLHELDQARARRSEVAVVYQAGSLSHWLIRRLWPQFGDAFHLDFGMVLNSWYPQVAEGQRWFRDNRKAVIRNLGLDNLYGTSN